MRRRCTLCAEVALVQVDPAELEYRLGLGVASREPSQNRMCHLESYFLLKFKRFILLSRPPLPARVRVSPARFSAVARVLG